jgi:uncharacterized Rmd1/YagE family protein
VFNAALDNYLLAPPLPRTNVRRYDKDVVHIRLTASSGGMGTVDTDGYGSSASSSSNGLGGSGGSFGSFTRHGIDDEFTGTGEVYVFSYGAVVTYGLTETVERAVRYALGRFETGRFDVADAVSESFRYQYFARDEPQSPTLLRVVQDTLLIASSTEDELMLSVKLAVAYAMSQHLKLCCYESELDKVSARVQHLPAMLAATGTLNISKRDILRLQGELFTLVSTPRVRPTPPDFIWDRDHLEHCACFRRQIHLRSLDFSYTMSTVF